MMKIGQLVRKKRLQRDLKQGELGDLIGVTGSFISMLETGKLGEKPTMLDTTLRDLCKVLNLNYPQLYKVLHPEAPTTTAAPTGIVSPENPHLEQIEIAQRQGLIKKPYNPHAIETIESMSGMEGGGFASPQAAAKAYKETLKRPVIRLLTGFYNLTAEQQDHILNTIDMFNKQNK